ncbi:hypothetical protein TNCV_2313771 [Trichonephila clavipes]|nr:hypothetical protein TNCV_2313771 [Trichonephila clavipes]
MIVSQEIAPHTVTPCEIAVCRSTIMRGSDRWPLRLQICGIAVVISTETESGFITEDDTSRVCHTPSCPRSAKIQSTLPMMWGQCDVVGAEVATLLIARSSRSFVFRDVLTLRDGTLYLLDPLLPTPSNYHIVSDRGGGRYVYSQPASLRLIMRPIKGPSAARTAAGYVLEAS